MLGLQLMELSLLGSIWKMLHYWPFSLPNHRQELKSSLEEGPTCSDCQFSAIICLMRPPDMMPRSWTIRAELVAAGRPTPQDEWSIILIGVPGRNRQYVAQDTEEFHGIQETITAIQMEH